MNVETDSNSHAIRDALRELASGCQRTCDVAEKLGNLAIQGELMNGQWCPVAVYLKRKTNNFETVIAGSVLLHRSTWPRDHIRLPLVIRDFVREFDLGKFLELVKPD